jgi:UDP-N-acetylglucosamine:LPS N-acetylglucosamine transferase
MRVLFTSMRATGHLQPLVPFIKACLKRGHDVAVASPAEMAERVAKSGAKFIPFAHPGDAALGPLWARFRVAPPEEGRRVVLGEIFAGLLVKAGLPDMIGIVEKFRPDVVVREAQEFNGLLAAEKHGVPHVRVAITLGNLGMVLPIQAPALDSHRAGIGLSLDPSGERVLNAVAITQIPLSLEFPDTLGASRVKRYRDARHETAALPDWWRGSRDPLVYLTLGTVTGDMEIHRDKFRFMLDAVAGLPIRVLLTTGVDPALVSLGDVPDNVHVEQFVPQADVLGHAAVVVCHGGSGTVIGSLAAGVPLVIAPLFADQPENSQRINDVGAGIGLAQGQVTKQAVRDALSRVLAEPSFRSGARRLADEIAALPSVDDAALLLEQTARSS